VVIGITMMAAPALTGEQRRLQCSHRVCEL
jgi:hypothetical protein